MTPYIGEIGKNLDQYPGGIDGEIRRQEHLQQIGRDATASETLRVLREILKALNWISLGVGIIAGHTLAVAWGWV